MGEFGLGPYQLDLLFQVKPKLWSPQGPKTSTGSCMQQSNEPGEEIKVKVDKGILCGTLYEMVTLILEREKK